MAAHAAVPVRRRTSTPGWALPATLGAVYGLYTSFMARGEGVGSWGQFLYGIVSAVALAGAVYALRREGHVLPRELRATAWAALAGIAIGFLFSLSDASVVSSTVLGLVVAAGMFCASFYFFYTHEDAAGRPVRGAPS
ncbi:hypothetical protein [Streptomyces vilmorinianum]|uniref:hypothetical protein n=1 Tax=Streptomyces vilmorinianum TaxID=3051092 RepID=UPI0010FB7171|nr:hypothetical protein [Streptomyces vilmorinianum]